MNPPLKLLGFKEKEARLYLALVQVGRATAQRLSSSTHISRTTVYPIVKKLIARGLVYEELAAGVTYFVANPAQALRGTVLEVEKELRTKQAAVEEVIKIITPHFKVRTQTTPTMQFFEGKKNIKNMLLKHTDTWLSSMRNYDNTLWGYQDHTFVENYHEWLEEYWKRKDKGHRIQLFSNQSDAEARLEGRIALRRIKKFPVSYEFNTTIWISGDYITMIVTRQEPHYAFQLRDELFAANLRSMFMLLWEQRR